ncbi:NADH oxidase [Chitinophaga parva]|uniref:NADH oxidase n=1 Tax=Chitinophaga parva TaxID=2169414 RepID=A0A2T7BCM4_9BACT|nr:rhodanese-like domain-containing protein [Chitinophaga parva]PUZ22844.1 NADH oxidase [Chitinophaga parva]
MQDITAAELKARMDAGETLHIVDVREPHEHEDFNIGGLLLPLGDIRSLQTEPIDDWKEQEVIVYCRSGGRSGQACMVLDSLGFTNTKNLVGGMLNWESTFGR